MDNITLGDACKFEQLNELEPETQEVMVNAPQELHLYLNRALMESFNPKLLKVSHGLRKAGFSAEQAIEVIYTMPAHREPKGNEIERAVSNAYDAEQGGKINRSDWPEVEVPLEQVKANIEQAGIVPMSEDELLAQLGDTPEEIDNVADFISHYFKGVERPVYIGDLYHGAIENISTWLADPEAIDALGYDQVLANPMKRRLTAEERKTTVTDAKGKVKLKYASGGRGVEFANETMEVITFESDKLSAEEQFAVIAYLAGFLPLVSIVYSGGKSYHATFSLKGLSRDQVMAVRTALVALGGDESVMSPYQLVRLGAVTRSDKGNKFQRVLWMDGDARNTAVDSDKLAELLNDANVSDIYHYKDRYWILDDSGEKYISLNCTSMTRRLKMLGYSHKAGEDGSPSAIDTIKDNAIFSNTIDFASPVAGRSIGLQTDDNGKRFLISSKNKRADAVQGDWSTIRDIVEGMLKDQVIYLYAWLKIARKQLHTEQFTQGHVLALAGAPGCGKSLTGSTIIKPLLGRSSDPTKYLTTESSFNANLITSELLIMDDKAQRRTAEAKTYLAHSLKDIAASSYEVDCEPKGVDAFQVHPLWRMLYMLNDDDAALCAFPPIGEGDCNSVGDKVLLLKCWNDTPLPFTGHHHQSMMLKKTIAKETAAFAYHVDNFEIPASIKTGSCRFGFDEFHDHALLETINQDTNERTLLSATDEIFFGKDSIVPVQLCPTLQRTYWIGTASEWSELLRADKFHGASKTINGELAYGCAAQKAGKVMARVSTVSDGRVVKDNTRNARRWRIWSPKDDEPVDVNPF